MRTRRGWMVLGVAVLAAAAARGGEQPPALPALPDVRAVVRARGRAVVRVEGFEHYLPGLVRRSGRLLNPFPLRRTLPDVASFALFLPSIVVRPMRKRLGSGVIVDPKGLLLTNHHVVRDADRVRVRLDDAKGVEQVFTARVLGTDRQTDLALLAIEPGKVALVAAPLGDSEELERGDWVVAIGTPANLTGSVTVGVVSGLHRRLGASSLEDYIQVEAALNPGNSGGPILNTRGEVVGIVSLGLFPSNNIGFAIPTGFIRPYLEDLRTVGRPRRGYLGAALRDITPELARKKKLSATRGILVSRVFRSAPAGKAGVRAGDVVLAYDGKATAKARDLVRAVLRTRPGTTVTLRLHRRGKTLTRTATVGERRRPFRFF